VEGIKESMEWDESDTRIGEKFEGEVCEIES
jgi:hypothetical protein